MTRPAVAALRQQWAQIPHGERTVLDNFVERLLAAMEAPPPLDKILEVMRDKSLPDDLALSEIQNYLKIAGYDVPLRSYRGDDPPERLSAWVAASTSVRQALTVVCPYCAAVVGIYCDPVGTFVHAARIDVAVRGEAPPEPEPPDEEYRPYGYPGGTDAQ